MKRFLAASVLAAGIFWLSGCGAPAAVKTEDPQAAQRKKERALKELMKEAQDAFAMPELNERGADEEALDIDKEPPADRRALDIDELMDM
jgi:hypothetical protein